VVLHVLQWMGVVVCLPLLLLLLYAVATWWCQR
jgi:hypothetical protein